MKIEREEKAVCELERGQLMRGDGEERDIKVRSHSPIKLSPVKILLLQDS